MDKLKLDGHLAFGIVCPLMTYADMMQEADYGPQGAVLCVLVRDAERRIAQVFAQINEQSPGITVLIPGDNENTSRFYIECYIGDES